MLANVKQVESTELVQTREGFGFLAVGIAVFALAFLLRLWFGLCDGHSQIVFACDASEYLRDAKGLSELATRSSDFWMNCIASGDKSEVHKAFEHLRELRQAGPVFPLFLSLSFLVFNCPVAAKLWFAPVVAQAVITSLTCVLIAFLGRVTWNLPVGVVAGISAALYPAFIVNSARMYSESFSCFLLCLVVALLIPAIRSSSFYLKNSLALGAVLAMLQVTRSVMVLITGAVLLYAGVTAWRQRKVGGFVALVVGMALVMAPWLAFQELSFGKSSVLVDRVGHYNLFIGTCMDSQGWLAYPYQDGRGIEKHGLLSLLAREARKSPERFLRLMMDKPVRLFKVPWNDFRTNIGIFDYNKQILFHQLLLLFAAIGISLAFLRSTSAPANRDWSIRAMFLSIILMHLVYLFFITVPRYNLTAMPFVILFSAAGATSLVSLVKRRQTRVLGSVLASGIALAMLIGQVETSSLQPSWASSTVGMAILVGVRVLVMLSIFACLYLCACCFNYPNRLARGITAVLCFLVLPFYALPLRAHGRLYEWRAPIGDSMPIVEQQITIPQEKLSVAGSKTCYLIVDCDDWQLLGSRVKVLVNDCPIDGPVLPLFTFLQNLDEMKAEGKSHYLECEHIFNMLCHASQMTNLDLRQWFAVPINPSIMSRITSSENGVMRVKLVACKPIESSLFGSSIDSHGGLRYPSVEKVSWEKAFYGVESSYGLTDIRFETKLARSLKQETKDLSAIEGVQSGQYNIRLIVPGAGQAGEAYRIKSRQSTVPQGGEISVSLSAGELPKYDRSSLWTFRVCGCINVGASCAATPTEFSQVGSSSVVDVAGGSIRSAQSSANRQVDQSSRSAVPCHDALPIVVRLEVRSKDEQGKEHVYNSPWIPDKLEVVSGRNQFSFSAPFAPVALPGKLQSVLVRLKSDQKFSLRNERASATSLSLDVFSLPNIPTSYGFEVL
ncbi:MAG: glycosyltransferase family 39 protein [Cyanobacteria bacterium]|nr:glycosyltransferase family 39 protein [Cyanobacteriota bacterium]